MKGILLVLVKNGLAVAGLKMRTIRARLKLFKYKSLSIEVLEINRELHSVHEVNMLFGFLPKETKILESDEVLIHNKTVDLNTIFRKELDKQDYLQFYTLHYLNFAQSNKSISRNLLNDILDSKISSQPFIESMQLFNIVIDPRLSFNVDSHKILEKYNSLYRNIEFHVDGNHVIENLISLTVIELKFRTKIFPTLPILIDEIERQSGLGFHSENNMKYAKDLCIKLDLILAILNHYGVVSVEVNRLNILISSWRSKLFENSQNLVLHDNIDGDELENAIDKYKSYFSFKKTKAVNIFVSIPAKGIRGHAFDAKIAYPFSGLYKAFGTITYASGKKRNYERLRSNNCQVYLSKFDVSHIFHLSFRSVMLLPYQIKGGEFYNIGELLVSNKSLVYLRYRVDILNETIVISSKNDVKIDLFVDDEDMSALRVQKTLNSNTVSVRRSLRAVKINQLKSSNRITLEGKSISIFI